MVMTPAILLFTKRFKTNEKRKKKKKGVRFPAPKPEGLFVGTFKRLLLAAERIFMLKLPFALPAMQNHAEKTVPLSPMTTIQQTETTVNPQTPLSIPFTRSRRVSTATCCSSSSSLCDFSLNAHDIGNETTGLNFYSDDDAGFTGYAIDDEDEEDTDIETQGDILPRSIRNKTRSLLSSALESSSLLGKNWKYLHRSGTKSPSYFKERKREYFSSPKESTPIFKRIVNKNSLKPQLKSFRRISSDLLRESDLLQSEICHEKLVLLTLERENSISSSDNMSVNSKILELENTNNFKKYDIIKRANETWNMKKHGSILREKSKSQLQEEVNGSEKMARNELVRKRSNEEPIEVPKRRAVSSSPISTAFFRRGHMKLVSKTSSDLEKMTL